MKYLVLVSYEASGESAERVRERAKDLIGSDANISVRKVSGLVTSPQEVFRRWKKLGKLKQEMFVVIALDTQNSIIKSKVVSLGTLNASLIHPREVFNFAIKNTAASIIIAHNHPSGSVDPSEEDLAVTTRLRDAGHLLGIQLLDHVIITRDSYKSLREFGLW